MTTASYDMREDIRLLRLHHRRVHRITALAHQESAARATVIARLRDHGVNLAVIAAAIGVTIPAIQGILARAGLNAGVVMGSGTTLTTSEENR